MKKTVKYVVCTIVFVGFAFIYSHVDKIHAIYNEDVDNSTYLNTGILLDSEIEQQFIPVENRLDSLRIKCVTVGESADSNIEYKIIDNASGQIIRQGIIDGAQVLNNKFLEIDFEVIEDCEGKEYTLSLYETGVENSGIGFYLENSIPNTCYTVDGEKRDGTLIIRTVTQRLDIETFFVVVLFEIYFLMFIKIMYKLFK